MYIYIHIYIYVGFGFLFNDFVKFSRQRLKPGFLFLVSIIIIVSDAGTSAPLVKVNSAYMKHKV